jgi:3-hydroxyisobutyrate dehydrogenase-like beta-hydroxyacid dehydrogenase
MAETGQLICVLAGPEAAVEKVKPYTEGVISRLNIDFSGQAVGKAGLLKIVGNTFILNMVETLSEGHVLAEKSGLGTDNLHQFIGLLFPGIYQAYSTRMTSGEYHKRAEPLFAVDLARKDARHALALAKDSGIRLKALEVAEAHLGEVKEHMGTRGDSTSIYGAVRKESGLKFEN